jgi:hypothetical protein
MGSCFLRARGAGPLRDRGQAHQRQFLVAARGGHSVLTLFILVEMAGVSPLDLSTSCCSSL